jgi:glycosyltransferase involved in cell wall biosynthesis
MRILLASSASYAPPRGGSTRSNLAWLRHLAGAGHACRIVCGGDVAGDWTALEPNIEVRPVPDGSARAEALRETIHGWAPDRVLVSSEDLSHTLLRAASRAASDRLVYIAHTPQFFPFGRESWNADRPAAGMVRGAAGMVAISHFVADYVERELAVRPAVIHPPIYGAAPHPRYRNFAQGLVLMINPCEVKGIDILLGAAQRMPNVEFGALRGWGTTRRDAKRIEASPNIRLLEPVRDIDELLRNTRVLLMPSLWCEGFGLIVMEAMLRGVPVVASNSGGLAEAKAGTQYVIPVKPIERYGLEFDENHLPKVVVTRQDIGPWVAALDRLLTDEAEYDAESERSITAAARFVASLDGARFEEYLLKLLRPAAQSSAKPELSAARRALLEKLLRAKGAH